MSRNPRSPASAGGMGQRPRAPAAGGERLKQGHPAARPGAGPFHGSGPGPFQPPPPYPPGQVSLRGLSGAPPPPPYPPPYPSLGYYYGMVPAGPGSAFEVNSGMGVARGYGYGYGYAPPPPPGMPVGGAPQAAYSGYSPQGAPHPASHGTDSGASRGRSQGLGGRRLAGATRRDARPSPPPVPPPPPAPEGANASGLPIRQGKPDCKHFLSRGWCSYGKICKYNHPEVAPGQPAPQQQEVVRAMAPSHGVMGMVPNPWMQYPMYGWPMPAGSEGSMYTAGWPPSTVMYYAPPAPPAHKADKRYPPPPSYSARSSDSAASTSSRMGDRDGLSERRGSFRR